MPDPSSPADFDPGSLNALESKQREHHHAWSFEVEPWLFGGGAQTRKGDRVSTVRPPSVLGQLRFFWRLLEPEPEAASSREALRRFREREARIFGAASQAASFRASVQMTRTGTRVTPVPRINDSGGYVTFPARAERRSNTPEAEIGKDIAFELHLFSGDEPHESLLRAIRVWSLLGGVGGRTRRGLGAVHSSDAPRDVAELKAELGALLQGRAGETPILDGSARRIRQVWVSDRNWRSAWDAFEALDGWYKAFRQDRRPGRPRPGRSFWDEPEEIRRITGQREPRHQALPMPQGKHAPGFARLVLGLPIITQFGDRGDPVPTTLQPARDNVDRMASPLLFRPLRLGNRYVGIVTLLSAPYLPPGGVELKSGRRSAPIAPTADPDAVFEDLLQSGDLRLGRVV